ncbi:glycosyltransferase [Paenibacillus sp. 7541]|uniref:glycosyltransferase family 2 protein n=1 Tax=Paenibacillus sp. 7541 TaxID=2026236 RepID=UPI00159509FF|nr:glycosyltransferase [Paenibacillus sp. 7541]
MNKNRVCVIVRTKDRPLLLKRALNSIFEQTYTDWGIILINNGGEVGPLEILLEQYEENMRSKIKTIHLKQPAFMEVATNTAIKQSDSEFITLLDDDDTWDPEFLKVCVDALDTSGDIDGIVTHSIIIVEYIEDKKLYEVSRKNFNERLANISFWKLSRKNLFTTNAFVYRRNVIRDIGLYREDLPVLGDWEFNMRFIKSKRVKVVPQPLAYYHKRDSTKIDSYSNTNLDLHIKYDELIRTEYLKQCINEREVIKGIVTFGFGKLNQIIRLIKTSFNR